MVAEKQDQAGEIPRTRSLQDSETEETLRLRAEVRRLTAALEDMVALADSGGDSRARVNLMLRRAMAALSGTDRGSSPSAGGTKPETQEGR